MSVSTILLVDDDEVLSQVLRRVLTRDGYTVVLAGSVSQALERAREQPLSLGLIDLRLPDGDGVELAQQLEREGSGVPLILMTAYPLRLRDQPELAKGFVHVLTKPLNLDELRQAIRSSLNPAVSAKGANSPRTAGVEASPPLPQNEPAAPGRSMPHVHAEKAAVKRHPLRWAALAGVALTAACLIAVLSSGVMPDIQHLFAPTAKQLAAPHRESPTRLVPGSSDQIELPPEVIERLGVKSDPVEAAAAPRPMELAGSLSFDPNHFGSIESRFPGEVIAIGTTAQPNPNGSTSERPLEYGDSVAKGHIMAVVWCKDLGEKKSELVDALTQLALNERRLSDRQEAYRLGALSEDTLNQTRTDVAKDRNAAAKAERTLRTWKVPEEEIQAVKEEARLVSEGKKQRDSRKELEWAKVEVRAPFDGTIVEKSLNVGKIVDPGFDLFKIADLRKLGVVVHAYEEDLRTLETLPRGFPWKIRAGADPSQRVLQSDGIQKVGLVIDPAQHTDPIMGRVDNSSGELRVGQFVTATVNLPAPPRVVSLPASAIEEDGKESIVFVQPDPSKPRYLLRRVSVALRLRDAVYVRSELTEQEREQGLHEVRPGEWIVTEGVLELKSALEDLQAKAKAQK